MTQSIARATLVLLAVSWLCSSLVGADKPAAPAPKLAVNLVRLTNTAEMQEFQSKHRFLPWEDLFNSPAWRSARTQNEERFSLKGITLGRAPEVIPGFEMRLALGPGQSHYQLALISKESSSCGTSYFSDERGLIYEAKPMGCAPSTSGGR